MYWCLIQIQKLLKTFSLKNIGQYLKLVQIGQLTQIQKSVQDIKKLSYEIIKAPSGIWTHDLYITNVTLYQAELSEHETCIFGILIILEWISSKHQTLNFSQFDVLTVEG